MRNIDFITEALKQIQAGQAAPQPSDVPPAALPMPNDPRPAIPLPDVQMQTQVQPRPMEAMPEYPASLPPPIVPMEQGTGSMPVDLPPMITRDRVAAVPPPLPAIAPPSERDRIAGEINALAGKKYNPGVWKLSTGETTSNPKKAEADRNNDGFKVITEPGKDRDKKWSLLEKIGAGIAGWAQGGLAGGIAAGTDRNYFEKLGDQNQMARLLPQLAVQQKMDLNNSKIATEGFRQQGLAVDAQGKHITNLANVEKFKQIIGKPYVDSAMKKGYLTDSEVAHIKKTFGFDITDPNNREFVEKQENGRWFVRPKNDPVYKENTSIPVDPTEEPIQVNIGDNQVPTTSKQLLPVLAGSENQNAARVQSAAQSNAAQALEAQKANVTNAFNYSKELFNRASEIGKAHGESVEQTAVANSYLSQMEAAQNDLQRLDPITNEKEYASAQKMFVDAQEKFNIAVGKRESGVAAAQQMASQGITKPGAVTFRPITAARSNIKTVPPSRDRMRLFQ